MDIASWAPGHVDVIARDSAGSYWDCPSNDGKTLSGASCVNWGHAPSGAFIAPPGVAALGDGRLLLAGRPSANGSSVNLQLVSRGTKSPWEGYNLYGYPDGALNSGVDVTTW